MEVNFISSNFSKKSCDFPQGCSSPRETSNCFRKNSTFTSPSPSGKLRNSQREGFEVVLQGLRSTHTLSKLERKQLLSRSSFSGYGSLAQEFGTAIARQSELETEQGNLGRRGSGSQCENSCTVSSPRIRVCRIGTNLRSFKSFSGFSKSWQQFRVGPICSVDNGVASEVVLESPSTNLPSHTPGSVLLQSASYIESLALPVTEQRNNSSKAIQTLNPAKKSISDSEDLTEVNSSRPGQLVECFQVEGGRRLFGEVQISGAKNSALAVLAGAICAEGQVHLEMIPDLHDIRRMLQVLMSVGVKVRRTSSGFLIDARDLTSVEPCPETVRKLRASFFVIGSLLGRKGEAIVPLPGGCNIGARPIDLHVRGLEALGAEVDIRQGKVFARAHNGKNLTGGSFRLDYPSVGATETLMMAAALADGYTTLSNVAQEPEVVDLANFLISCGACIQGAGTSTLRIKGSRKLHGTEHRVIPDRIEAGTFLIAAAITRSSISVNSVVPKHLTSVMEKLGTIGCRIQQTRSDSLHIDCTGTLRSCNVKTLPYPGFPTDLQPQLMSLLTTCSGQSLLEETVFEGRMRHAEELQKLGAELKVNGNIAIINGKGVGRSMYGASVLATDLRAGAALVLAGISAEGITLIEGVSHIDRGYEKLDKKFRLLGASIQRLPCLPTELAL